MFPPAGANQTECVGVNVISDMTLENEETLCLNLSSSDPDVIISSSSVTTCIIIEDRDGGFQ